MISNYSTYFPHFSSLRSDFRPLVEPKRDNWTNTGFFWSFTMDSHKDTRQSKSGNFIESSNYHFDRHQSWTSVHLLESSSWSNGCLQRVSKDCTWWRTMAIFLRCHRSLWHVAHWIQHDESVRIRIRDWEHVWIYSFSLLQYIVILMIL